MEKPCETVECVLAKYERAETIQPVFERVTIFSWNDMKLLKEAAERNQNLIDIKLLAIEAYKRFVDYDMSVDCDVPHEHRDFMQRLKKHLEI